MIDTRGCDTQYDIVEATGTVHHPRFFPRRDRAIRISGELGWYMKQKKLEQPESSKQSHLGPLISAGTCSAGTT